MKRFLIITAFLLTNAGVCTADYDFRKTNWGMTMEQVIASEKTKPTQQNENEIRYETKILGREMVFHFTFENKKLISGIYSLNKKYDDYNEYIKIYNDFKEILEEKYGKPADHFLIHEDDENGKYVYPAEALKKGLYSSKTDWMTDTTKIQIILTKNKDNNEILFFILYDKNTSLFEKKKQEAEDARKQNLEKQKALESF